MTLATTLVLAILAASAPAAADKDAPVLLDFHAEWCGPCRQMRPAVEQLVERGYPIRSIDIDESPEMAERYGVSQVPTFVVVDRSGKELARNAGAQPAASLAGLYNTASTKFARLKAASANAASTARAGDDEGQAPKPWETTVRIKIYAPNSVGFGSGTIIHSTPEESVILTCAHIFQIDGNRQPIPPSKFPRKIRIDLFDGQLHGLNPAMVHPVEEGLPGEAIDYDFATDVGLIRIRPGRKLASSPVVPPDWTPAEGLKMTTVGCSEGHNATAWSTHITNPGFKGLVGNGRYEAIECNHAPKQGRSGGGLFTLDGYLAGVCDFAEPKGRHGLYASPRSIYRMLDKNELAFCYNPSADRPDRLIADRGGRRGAAAAPVLVRGQDSPLPAANGARYPMPEPEAVGVRLDPIDEANPGRKGGWQAPSRSNGGTSVALASAPSRRASVVRRPPSREPGDVDAATDAGSDADADYQRTEIPVDPSAVADDLPDAALDDAAPAAEPEPDPAPRPGSSLQGWKRLRRPSAPR
jgi:thiol-disulfide isomerase/thioredoxin